MTGVIDLATRQAEVTAPELGYGGSAVDRALSFILMQELPREHDALLLHGVATVRHGWGLAHSGRSGVGKTTTARLAAGYADVLVDENLVISLAGARPALLSTPFWGGSTPQEMIRRVNRQAPLRALLLPEHGAGVRAGAAVARRCRAGAADHREGRGRARVQRRRLAGHGREAGGPGAHLPPLLPPHPELWPFLDEALGPAENDECMNDER